MCFILSDKIMCIWGAANTAVPCGTINAAWDGSKCYCAPPNIYVSNTACCSPGGVWDAVQKKCVCPAGTTFDTVKSACVATGVLCLMACVCYIHTSAKILYAVLNPPLCSIFTSKPCPSPPPPASNYKTHSKAHSKAPSKAHSKAPSNYRYNQLALKTIKPMRAAPCDDGLSGGL